MAKPYDPKSIEKKWQKYWEKEGLHKAEDFSDKPKAYVLDMFPYPSGLGLHVGHPIGYIATDVLSRYLRMNGKNVLHPMGWDAFGLPAENYAIKNKVHPRVAVEENIKRFKEQLALFGFSYDWSREINTTDPKYYKWTQWIFLQLFKAGLAYEDNIPINFCLDCKTGLANEEVRDGKCERCGHVVEKRRMRQWVLKITDYADRLLEDLDDLDWTPQLKEMQRNWIGRSEGAEVTFKIKSKNENGEDKEAELAVYTTRPDTLFGATYVVLAPEHSLLEIGKLEIGNLDEVRAYIEKSLNKSDLERKENKEKTGVRLKGVFAINPMNGEELPVFVADYVLMQYGTGAIMAVPAHDERDFEFATKFKLPIVQVISSDGKTGGEVSSAMSGDGILVNSGDFTGMKAEEARKKITANLAEKGAGTSKVNYKLRDWIFSRQRYWGEPIPIIHCKDCGVVPVPEEELPLLLPEVESYEPTGTGESPLAAIDEWVNVKCPKCAGPARRETNTMPQWAGSCWYYLRYIDPDNEDALVDPKKEKYWMPIDLYLGGAEHAVLHLLYARFWHKVLFDGGHVSTSEPFLKLFNQGMILGEDHQKMSKSRGNVVSPDEVIEQYGADSFRLYEMFMGPLEQEKPWDTQGIIGTFRFLRKVYSIMQNVEEGIDDEDPIRLPQRVMQAKLVAKVSKDIDGFDMNTAISAMMEYLNERLVRGPLSRQEAEIFVLLLAPFAPHLTEEIWQEVLEKEGSVHRATWPKRDAEGEKLAGAIVVIRVQVNGKRRGIVNVQKGSSKAKVIEVARALGNVKRAIGDSDIKKTIFVQDIVVNFIVG